MPTLKAFTAGRRSANGVMLALLCGLAFTAPATIRPAHAWDATATGKLVFWRTSRLSTPVMGRIAALPVRVGDPVKKGDVVAEIETDQLKADLNVAEAALASAKAEVVRAEAAVALERTEHERQARLQQSAAFSGARYEDTKNRLAVATAQLEAARATVQTREAEVKRQAVNVSLTKIRAPFDGVIVRHLLTVGGLVSIEDAHVLVLVDTSSPEIEIEVPAAQVTRFVVGSEVDFSIGTSGDREKAKVRAVLPAESSSADKRVVRLEPTNTATQFSDAVPVTVYLPNS